MGLQCNREGGLNWGGGGCRGGLGWLNWAGALCGLGWQCGGLTGLRAWYGGLAESRG